MRPMHEYEFESEWEGEGEFESEGEYEGEMEAEEFFGRIAQLARRAAQNPALRRIGLQAARGALSGLRGTGPAGAAASSILGGFLPQREYEGEFESEFESEFEGEGEFESEDFVNPQRRLARVQSEALMAHLGNKAASAESEDEAEAFIGALVPIAARLIPRVAPAVMRAAPQLIRGISNVAQRLRSNPATQQLVRTLPTVARNTVGQIARQVAQGRPVTAQTAVRALAQQTARVIGNPRAATAAYQRNRALDRRYHQAVRQPVARPAAGRPVPPRPPYRARPAYPPRPVYRPRPRYAPRPGYGGMAGGAMPGGYPGGMHAGGYPGGMPGGGAAAYPGVDPSAGGYVDPSAAAGGYAVDPSGGGGYADPSGGGYDAGGGGYDAGGGYDDGGGGGYDAGVDGGGYAPADEEMYF